MPNQRNIEEIGNRFFEIFLVVVINLSTVMQSTRSIIIHFATSKRKTGFWVQAPAVIGDCLVVFTQIFVIQPPVEKRRKIVGNDPQNGSQVGNYKMLFELPPDQLSAFVSIYSAPYPARSDSALETAGAPVTTAVAADSEIAFTATPSSSAPSA